MKIILFYVKKILPLLLFVLIISSGCATKMEPNENILTKSISLSRENAAKILNNNIYMPGKYMPSSFIDNKDRGVYVVAGSIGLSDNRTNIQVTDNIINFKNLVKHGKFIEKSGNYKYYEKEYYNREVTDINLVTLSFNKLAKRYCDKKDYLFSLKSPKSNYFLLCVREKEDFLAAIIKLFPEVELRTLEK